MPSFATDGGLKGRMMIRRLDFLDRKLRNKSTGCKFLPAICICKLFCLTKVFRFDNLGENRSCELSERLPALPTFLFSFFLIFNVVSVDLGCWDRQSTVASFIEMLAPALCSIVHKQHSLGWNPGEVYLITEYSLVVAHRLA